LRRFPQKNAPLYLEICRWVPASGAAEDGTGHQARAARVILAEEPADDFAGGAEAEDRMAIGSSIWTSASRRERDENRRRYVERNGARNGLTMRSRSSGASPSCVSSDHSVSQSACSAEATIMAS
jgi:hypothetical protein